MRSGRRQNYGKHSVRAGFADPSLHSRSKTPPSAKNRPASFLIYDDSEDTETPRRHFWTRVLREYRARWTDVDECVFVPIEHHVAIDDRTIMEGWSRTLTSTWENIYSTWFVFDFCITETTRRVFYRTDPNAKSYIIDLDCWWLEKKSRASG